MLRASSLGLAFTHGISRCYLVHSSRWLHKQIGHEFQPISSGSTHLHTKEETEMSTDTAQSVTLLPSPPPFSDSAASNLMASAFDTAPMLPITSQASNSAPNVAQMPTALETSEDSSASGPQEAAKGPRRGPLPRHLLSRYASRDHMARRPMYEQLAEATDIDEAWQLYQNLLEHRPAYMTRSIPHKYLHAFAAALVKKSSAKPASRKRTQTVFLRLLSVLNTIYYTGGQVLLWEWNALIDAAGRGWRKTRMDDFQAALSILQDMVADRAPGSSFAGATFIPPHDKSQVTAEPVEPNIVTYTSLIAIAGRTLKPDILHLAESYLVSSGHSPNRITFLVYLRFHARKGRLGDVRLMMFRVLQNGWRLGQDGMNALLWAYGRNGRLDIAGSIYRVVRHHAFPDDPSNNNHAVQTATRTLKDLESITIPSDVKPDAITYYTLIQVYAYHGRLRECLDVFTDMMTSPVPVAGTLQDMENYVPGLALPNPILPVFRSIFLGFARHAVPPDQQASTALAERSCGEPPSWRAWTSEQLHTLFDNFITLPPGARPNARTVYSVLVAFAITSGYDQAVLRNVWERLEDRYGGRWDGRVDMLRDKICAEKFDRVFFERLHTSRERRGWNS
ncbi:hypothetical protein BC628DRAFT_1346934 [Trametes gibbosa]|nr:hypothetical protein BC628DRAFT_1346934 [Trametes gibbosa]